MSDIPVTNNKDYDVESLWISWCLTPNRMEIKYEDSNSVSYVVDSLWDNDSMISGYQNLTMYLRAKDEEIKKLQAQLNEANRFIDCLEAETSSMDMCKKIESYREKYKVVSNE
jgi:hypothetical protein